MPVWSELHQRELEPEVMDDPALDPQMHRQALSGLARLNLWSGSVRIIWPPIRNLAQRLKVRSLKVLDLASGAGDVPIALWKKAQGSGLNLEVDGCDCSPEAVAHAQAQAQGTPVRFFTLDALNQAIPLGYDVITTSLFLHHLSNEQAIQLIRRMSQAAGSLILINDLVRSAGGLGLAYLGTRLLTRSPVVHHDGPQSVRAAFTVDEVEQLIQAASLRQPQLVRRWPFRFLMASESS